jgi:hypothetical protein
MGKIEIRRLHEDLDMARRGVRRQHPTGINTAAKTRKRCCSK